MSITPDYPQNVPITKQGISDSLVAPGSVGAGGTNCACCGKALIPSADVFDRIAGFPFEKCSCGCHDGKCSHCGNGLLEEFCHEPPFVRFSCTDCGCGMDKDLNVISQPRLIDVGISEVPENAIVMGFMEQDDGFKYPFGFVRGEGYFMCDRDGWALWNSSEGLSRAIGNRMLEQGA